MKYILLALSIVCFTFGVVVASEAPTKNDAKALVKQAVAYAKENGREKFFNEVRNPKGKFHFQEGTKKVSTFLSMTKRASYWLTVSDSNSPERIAGTIKTRTENIGSVIGPILSTRAAADGSAIRNSIRQTRTRLWTNHPS